MKHLRLISVCIVLAAAFHPGASAGTPRDWMSHRGVHLRSTIAGENSLEAVELARRAGFTYIETDCRWTADSVMVIMHDAALNRTCTYADGTPLGHEKVNVADLSFEELRRDYRLKSAVPERRSVVPTLEEYLLKCASEGFKQVLIEPKLNDITGVFYQDVIRIADQVLGRDGYLVVSNNFANAVIRKVLGIKDVRLMGLLYQTDYETMDALGNTVFALSSTAFDDSTFRAYMKRTKEEGKTVESASGLNSKKPQDNFLTYMKLLEYGTQIDMIASDQHAPDFRRAGTTVCRFTARRLEKIQKRLSGIPEAELYGIHFEMKYEGRAVVTVGPDEFETWADIYPVARYSRMTFDSKPQISVTPGEGFKLRRCRVRIEKL